MRTRHLFPLLALAACARAGVSTPTNVAEADRDNGDPSGHSLVAVLVRDTAGGPLDGAMVRLVPQRPAPDTTARLADSLGRVITADRAPGRYTLLVRQPGWRPAEAEIEVPPSCTVEVEARLAKPASDGRRSAVVVRSCGLARGARRP